VMTMQGTGSVTIFAVSGRHYFSASYGVPKQATSMCLRCRVTFGVAFSGSRSILFPSLLRPLAHLSTVSLNVGSAIDTAPQSKCLPPLGI
jgi:hypothetical protein